MGETERNRILEEIRAALKEMYEITLTMRTGTSIDMAEGASYLALQVMHAQMALQELQGQRTAVTKEG